MSSTKVSSMLNKQSKKSNLTMVVNNWEVKQVFEQEDTMAKEESKGDYESRELGR